LLFRGNPRRRRGDTCATRRVAGANLRATDKSTPNNDSRNHCHTKSRTPPSQILPFPKASAVDKTLLGRTITDQSLSTSKETRPRGYQHTDVGGYNSAVVCWTSSLDTTFSLLRAAIWYWYNIREVHCLCSKKACNSTTKMVVQADDVRNL
jgi:hypothetical protein